MKNRHISKGVELSSDAQQKSLWKTVVDEVEIRAGQEGVEFNPTQMVPIWDVSGSMMGIPMEVAIALSIGISEITQDAFKHLILTFDATLQWHRLDPTNTICSKSSSLAESTKGDEHRFWKAYDFMEGDMPSLIVFSDMQFDQACVSRKYSRCDGQCQNTMFEVVERKVAKVASQIKRKDSNPTPVVFWNLRNTGGHTVDKDTKGTVLLSGFSPSLLKFVLNGQTVKEKVLEVAQSDGIVQVQRQRITPEEMLKRMLNDTLCDPAREILGETTEVP